MYCTIFALAESPKQKGVLWAGSDDGLVHVSKDDGKTWENVTANIPDLPDWGTVCCIEASPHDAGTAYRRRPQLTAWTTTSRTSGRRPTSARPGPRSPTASISGTHCHAIREDGKKKGLLYLGTERGVMYSPDAGKTWKSLQLNLPTVPVHDLVVKDDDLVVGTHGRSIWILDDLTAVRETTDAIREQGRAPVPGAADDALAARLGRPRLAVSRGKRRGENPARRRRDLVPTRQGLQGRGEARNPRREGEP